MARVATGKQKDLTRIFDHFRCHPEGCTCDEVEVALNLLHQTCSARIYDLKEDGLLVVTSERRETRSGKMAYVLALPRFAKK